MEECQRSMTMPGSPDQLCLRRQLSNYPSPVRQDDGSTTPPQEILLSPVSQGGGYDLHIPISEDGDNFEEARLKYLQFIKSRVVELRVRRSVLSQKYKKLSAFNTSGQVSVIVLSTVLAAIESTKSQLDITKTENIEWYNVFSYLPLITAWSIAVLTAILRFFAFGERQEGISKVSEAIVTCKNEFKKARYGLETFGAWDRNKWTLLVDTKLADAYEMYLRTMEAFEKHVEFQELVYYQTLLRDDMVQWERINRDIDNMGKYYVSRRFDESACSLCGTETRFDFDAYAKEIETVERRKRTASRHPPDTEQDAGQVELGVLNEPGGHMAGPLVPTSPVTQD